MKGWTRALVVVLLSAAVAWGTFHHWRTKNVGPVQRGWAVAESKGCFACHGPGGLRGIADPGHGLGDVPDWGPGQMTMYATSDAELREWILDGTSRKVRDDASQRKLRDAATIRMPAWRGLLSERELADVVAYVKAVSSFDKPKDDKADAGQRAAAELGCFGCHGPQGRGALPNARAFKGYIPPWDGPDFQDLARSDQEIREWIEDGATARFRASRLARFFLERQPIKMPAYRGHVSDAQLDRLVDYIHWVQEHPY